MLMDESDSDETVLFGDSEARKPLTSTNEDEESDLGHLQISVMVSSVVWPSTYHRAHTCVVTVLLCHINQ